MVSIHAGFTSSSNFLKTRVLGPFGRSAQSEFNKGKVRSLTKNQIVLNNEPYGCCTARKALIVRHDSIGMIQDVKGIPTDQQRLASMVDGPDDLNSEIVSYEILLEPTFTFLPPE